MATLQRPIIFHHANHLKHERVHPLTYPSITKGKILNSSFWGPRRKCNFRIRVGPSFAQQSFKRSGFIRCNFSSFDGNGNIEENFSESDEDYVNSSVIEAVEVKSGSDGFFIRMRDGRNLRCVHNNPHDGPSPDYPPHPAIVLKMEDGSDLLLPIIVLEMPSILLMAAVRNVQIARPTIYQVIQEVIDKLGYQVKVVRITKRVHEAYFAQLYLTNVEHENECISFDLRPSDAINMAVRCKVPIQVNRQLAYSDGMKLMKPNKVEVHSSFPEGLLLTELDRPNDDPCLETMEFDLVRNMLIAAVEERYKDAAQWKDKLAKLRSKKKNWA